MENKVVFENIEKQDYARREAFNSLRTNLQFCGVDNKVIMFTSCTPNEGKSTVTGLKHLDRGYDNLEENLLQLGADIRRIHI